MSSFCVSDGERPRKFFTVKIMVVTVDSNLRESELARRFAYMLNDDSGLLEYEDDIIFVHVEEVL